jgi:hypothetical protein
MFIQNFGLCLTRGARAKPLLFLLITDSIRHVLLNVAADVVSKLFGDSREQVSVIEGVAWVDQLTALAGRETFLARVVPLAEPGLGTCA